MITSDELGALFGKFAWDFGMYFFIETPKGNFVWSDPDYRGSGEIWPTTQTFQQFAKGQLFRDKGWHEINRYCGDFTLVEKPTRR